MSPEPAGLDIMVGNATSPVLVNLQGQLTDQSAAALRGVLSTLVAQGHAEIQVDLAGVSFTDAVGLSVLTSVAQRVEAGGGQVLTLNLRPHLPTPCASPAWPV